MLTKFSRVLITVIFLVALMSSPLTASAKTAGDGLTDHIDGKEAHASGQRGQQSRKPPASGTAGGNSLASSSRADNPTYQEWLAAARKNDAAVRAKYRACVTDDGDDCQTLLELRAPDGVGVGGPVQPRLSAQELAYVASARLRLTAPKPMIGPSPGLNEWKMAAVGYPLWLWADGNLNPAPVSDSVYDISVTLDARLVKVEFDMGDGHQLNCTDLGRKWTRSVTPGESSPVCGYRYQKPSLPDGSYTVTARATWAIDWNISGTTGTIPFYQTATTTIPVGELQVLVR